VLMGRPKSRWYGIIKTCLKETGCKDVLMGRPKSIWYGIIKTCLKETGCKGVEWGHVVKMRWGSDTKGYLRMTERYGVKIVYQHVIRKYKPTVVTAQQQASRNKTNSTA